MESVNENFKPITITPVDKRMARALEALRVRNLWAGVGFSRLAFVESALFMHGPFKDDSDLNSFKNNAIRFWDRRSEDAEFTKIMEQYFNRLINS